MSGIGFLQTFQVSPFIGSLFSGILDNLYIFKGVTQNLYPVQSFRNWIENEWHNYLKHDLKVLLKTLSSFKFLQSNRKW